MRRAQKLFSPHWCDLLVALVLDIGGPWRSRQASQRALDYASSAAEIRLGFADKFGRCVQIVTEYHRLAVAVFSQVAIRLGVRAFAGRPTIGIGANSGTDLSVRAMCLTGLLARP
jgi:hypothetical protein